MRPTKPNIDILSTQLALLLASDLEELRAEWRRKWGDAPAYRSRDLLLRALAYKLQAELAGDLPAMAQRRTVDLAQRFMADRAFTPPAANTLFPGSCLIREWHGKRHEVAVLAKGFQYQGQTFPSLSKLAQHITGTKWNGRAFFGLTRKSGAE